jgi:hypothetical protein
MTVRQGANNFPRTSLLRSLTAECQANEFDEVRRKVRDVAESFVSDIAAISIRTAEQMGLVDLPFVTSSSGGYMNRAISFRHESNIANNRIIPTF